MDLFNLIDLDSQAMGQINPAGPDSHQDKLFCAFIMLKDFVCNTIERPLYSKTIQNHLFMFPHTILLPGNDLSQTKKPSCLLSGKVFYVRARRAHDPFLSSLAGLVFKGQGSLYTNWLHLSSHS
jgi:hypothetical protein